MEQQQQKEYEEAHQNHRPDAFPAPKENNYNQDYCVQKSHLLHK